MRIKQITHGASVRRRGNIYGCGGKARKKKTTTSSAMYVGRH
jgi:hypothetical protein